MVRRCPAGVVCTEWSTVTLVGLLLIAAATVFILYRPEKVSREPKIVVIQSPPQVQQEKPGMYSEPTTRYPIGLPTELSRGPVGTYGQIGILTAEGGSSSSASPDRTILPLYGREIDARRSRWNYYTRTDGANPVQVPIRYKNRVCDDDINGCDEIFNDDSVHVPSLGRSFKTTVYKKSLFA
jgi:hypothetical protein